MDRKIDAFFAELGRLTLSYNDVRLQAGYSEFQPADANLETRFSRNIPLKIPIVSSPMDTVTEAPMAIGMAMLGGLGVIHRNMTVEEQASMVRRVKLYINRLIEKPITAGASQTVSEVLQMLEEKNFHFRTLPVIDEDGKFVGLISSREFNFADGPEKLISDIMVPRRQVIRGRSTTGPREAYELMEEKKVPMLPLVERNGQIAGLYIFNDLKLIFAKTQSGYNVDGRGQLLVGAAVGTGEAGLLQAQELIAKGVDVLVLQTAHAFTKDVGETLRSLKQAYPNVDVVAGNISVPEAAEKLVEWGADGILVGQGPGSICTTRIIAGIGRPQVSAVHSCAKAIRGSGVPVCADGGIAQSGDIPIALGAGADNVMIGGRLAGTDEAPGEVEPDRGVNYKVYRGMGSLGAMQDRASRERYRQTPGKLVPEGIEGKVPCKGPLSKEIGDLTGGLRSGMGYVGAISIAELHEKADFDQITPAGMAESHPHDILITKEAPNYSRG